MGVQFKTTRMGVEVRTDSGRFLGVTPRISPLTSDDALASLGYVEDPESPEGVRFVGSQGANPASVARTPSQTPTPSGAV